MAFLLFAAFDFTTITFVKDPVCSVLYLTFIEFLAPGRIGSFGHVGTVQPHDENAEVMISGSLPVFSNSNQHSPSEPLAMVSKS